VIDITFKHLTYVHIPKMSCLFSTYPFGGIGIFEDFFGINFSINHVQNLGAAWGFLSSYTSFLFYLRIALIIGLAIYLIYFNKEKKQIFPLLLIVTGAFGNIIDMFVYGHVIDMFYFTFNEWSFPVFNCADIMISVGIFLLFLHSITSKKKEREKICKLKS